MNIIEDYWITNKEEQKPLIEIKPPENKTINYNYLEYVNENNKRNNNIFIRFFLKLFCCYY